MTQYRRRRTNAESSDCSAHSRWLITDDAVDEAMSDHESSWLEFQAFAQRWKSTRATTRSQAMQIASDPNYLRIIGVGPRAVPFILSELRRELADGEPAHWFTALWAITGENPVPETSQGKIAEMAQAWLAWGEERGHIDAKDLGIRVPKFG